MKKLLLVPLLAAIALFAQPVLAEDAHHPEKTAQAAQAGTAGMDEQMSAHENMMQESMKSMNKMQAQMATIHQTKDPKKRQKLLQEHRKSMLDSIKMVRDMMGGMGKGCPMMGGGHMKGGHMMGGCGMMGGAGCPMMGGNPAGQPDSNPDAAPAAQANPAQTATGKTTSSPEGKVWTCPMHPNVVRDQPGLCPICGMELVEKGQAGATQGQGHMMGCPMMGGSGCKMGGDMKCPMMGGSGGSGGCMMGGAGCPMMGSGGCPMMGMAGKHMDMMLMLMEQMIEHDEAAARR
ncbi:heavy metal-binding domain-containing protein [Candidatus Ferrigenium straubiae]|jgi:hypothetical protein|uniref:heavy metal-binding domain-containing protein n=1 Tax=Candidatus Ferrigenium straubiae TaxID=2919506 RepID=UPI003F4AA3D9